MMASDRWRSRASALGLRGGEIHLNWDSPRKAEEKEAPELEE